MFFDSLSNKEKKITKQKVDKIPAIFSLQELMENATNGIYKLTFMKILNALLFESSWQKEMVKEEVDIYRFVKKDLVEADCQENKEEFLFKKWTNPDNEVRNRLKLISIRLKKYK